MPSLRNLRWKERLIHFHSSQGYLNAYLLTFHSGTRRSVFIDFGGRYYIPLSLPPSLSPALPLPWNLHPGVPPLLTHPPQSTVSVMAVPLATVALVTILIEEVELCRPSPLCTPSLASQLYLYCGGSYR